MKNKATTLAGGDSDRYGNYHHPKTPADGFFEVLNAKRSRFSSVVVPALGATALVGGTVVVAETHIDAVDFVETAQANLSQALSDPKYQADDRHDIIVQISDMHDNFYIADVIAQIVKSTNAKTVVDCGDLTDLGAGVEAPFVEKIIQTIRESGADYVLATGNHDTIYTDATATAMGATVLDGAAVEVDGYRFIGDDDPQYFILPFRNDEQLAADKEQLEIAIRDSEDDNQPIDFVVKHNPYGGLVEHSDQDVVYQLSGHKHRLLPKIEPDQYGVLFDASNTNGQWRRHGDPMFGLGIGRPTRLINVLALVVDKTSPVGQHTVSGYFETTISTDGEVKVSNIRPINLAQTP